MGRSTGSDSASGGRYYCDERGVPRAELDAPDEALGWFLEQDVQASTARCDELIAIVVETMAHKRQPYQSTGNAHTLVIDQTGVLIENNYAEPRHSSKVSLTAFRRAVESWRDLVAQRAGAHVEDPVGV